MRVDLYTSAQAQLNGLAGAIQQYQQDHAALPGPLPYGQIWATGFTGITIDNTASTKGFLTQLVACYLLGLYLAQVREDKYGGEITETMRELAAMPDAISKVLSEIQPVMELAAEFADKRSVLFIGRHVGYPVALEGALKLKELAYIHAEGFAAGELKHGPIALIEDQLPVFVVVPPRGRDMLHDKVVRPDRVRFSRIRTWP